MKNLREALGAPQMGWLLAVLGTVIRQSKVGAEYLHPNRWKGHDLGPLRTRRRIPNHLRWARYSLLGVQTYLAGAHGQRRILGQSVNLAHLIWRKPCAPAPSPFTGQPVHPPGGFPRGAIGVALPLQSRGSDADNKFEGKEAF